MPDPLPDPDPMLRLVHADDLPGVFWYLPPVDRWRRLRLFLISQAAQGPHFPIVLWHIAFDMTPAGEAFAREVVDIHTDATIEAMVAEGRARWRGFDEARRQGLV